MRARPAAMRVRSDDEAARPEDLEQVVRAWARLDGSVMEPTQGQSGRTPKGRGEGSSPVGRARTGYCSGNREERRRA